MAFVRNPVVYVPDLTNGRPIVDGKVYLLTAGTVPPTQDSAINPADLLTVSYVNEAGNTITQPQPLYTSKGGCLYGSFPEEAAQYSVSNNSFVFAAYDKRGRLQYSAETTASDYIETDALAASDSTVLVGGVEAGSGLIKVFDNVQSMKAESIPVGITVTCNKYYSTGGLVAGLIYEVKPPQAADEFINHTLPNGNVAVLKFNGALNASHAGLVADSNGTAGSGTDQIPVLNAIGNYINANRVSLYVPACENNKWYRVNATTPTIGNPVIGMNITVPHIDIFGDGNMTRFFMDTINTTYLNSLPTEGGGGRDVFTVFSFFNTFNCSIRDMYAKGLYVKGVDPDLIVSRPRAKFVGCDVMVDFSVDRINGLGIAGNVLNCRGFSGLTRRVITKGCHAHGCAENGINYMGGTFDCEFSNNICIGNGFQGFESGTENLVCTGNIFISNKNGVSQVGRYGTISDNICKDNQFSGVHIQYNNASFDGRGNVVTSNICINNPVGILSDVNAQGNFFVSNRIIGSTDSAIKVPTTTNDFVIHSNYMRGNQRDLNILGSNHSIQENYCAETVANSLLISGTTNVKVTNNVFSGTISVGSAVSPSIEGNKGFITENYGVVTVASGATTLVIPHGLVTTPTYIDVAIDKDTYCYTLAPGATQFSVRKAGDVPFVIGEKVYWQAKVRF